VGQGLDQIRKPESNARLGRLAHACIVAAILLTGMIGILSWRISERAAQDAAWVAHTYNVIATLELTLRNLDDVETGARGFALTGQDRFLEPYISGQNATRLNLEMLHTLTRDNPGQQLSLGVLAELARTRLEAAADLVKVRQNTAKLPAASYLDKGMEVMDKIRVSIAGMVDQEKLLLEQRSQRARNTRHLTSSAIGLASILGIVFLFIAGLTISRGLRIAAKAQSQIKALNVDLEQRVEQRTAALQAESAARMESEGRLAGVIASAMDSIITVDDEQRIVLFNRAAEKMFRCPEQEVLGQPIARFIPQRFHAAYAGHILKFGELGVTNRAMSSKDVLWARRADGQEFQIEASTSQIEIAGRKIFTVILRDVTERRRAEESRERLAAIVDSSDDAIFSKTLDGMISAWNRGAEKLFGYSAAEIVGKPMLVLLPPERINEESDLLARIQRGESVDHFETVRVRKDGTRIDVSVTISPIRDGNGAIVGASKVARDITESKLKEEALRESEERFQTMANGIQQLAWMAEADGSIFWYNQRWYEYTGTTLEEARGWTWDKIIDPAFLPKVLDRWREAIATGTPFDMEIPLRGADGRFRMFLSRAMPVRNSEGHVVRWLGTNTDISDRKKAEEQLAQLVVELAQQAEKLTLSRGDLEAQTSMLKLVLESMGEGLIAADHEGHFLLWNDAANKLMGRGAIDLPTKQWTPHYKVFMADGITPCPPDRLPLVRALCGESVMVELMVQPPEPEPGKFIEVTARPLKDARGNLRGGVAVLHDITERKRSEADLAQQAEELRDSQRALETQTFMLQSVLDSMVEGLVAADEQGKFILWNLAADRIMGLGATNLPSEEWSAHYGLFLPDTVTPIPPGETPLERTLRGEAGTTEIFLRHAGLSRGLWLEATGSPLLDKDGVSRGAVLAFRDITQRKTDELEIRKLNEDLEDRIAKRTEQLEATNHELEAFSYSVSHDLRTPLRHVAGFARILVNDFGPVMAVEAREHLQHIEDAVSRMGLLIDALLKMAVLRRQSLRLGRSELNPIIDDVISMLQPECDGRDIEWRIAKLPALDCDPILMAQVFQNLLGNALKYSRGRAKAVIEVDSIQRPGKPAIIFVRDNGAGFNMKYAERLFGVFQRFHTESEFEGTGVGLATVHRIIQKHGGTIWAEAEVDHGATFYFALQMTEQIGTIPFGATNASETLFK
jgi:PAS domain S-box-containing protein